MVFTCLLLSFTRIPMSNYQPITKHRKGSSPSNPLSPGSYTHTGFLHRLLNEAFSMASSRCPDKTIKGLNLHPLTLTWAWSSFLYNLLGVSLFAHCLQISKCPGIHNAVWYFYNLTCLPEHDSFQTLHYNTINISSSWSSFNLINTLFSQEIKRFLIYLPWQIL